MQLEQHSRFRKRLQPRLLKQWAKHPVEVHNCGGISARSATNIVMLTGIMDAQQLSTVLEADLLPFLRIHYTAGHRLQQDNDPKHANRLRRFFIN